MARTKSEILCEARRAEILEAALSLFSEKGYELCSIDEIAAKAGLAKGTVYIYFKSKEELYKAVLGSALDERARRTLDAMGAAKTAREKIEAFISTRLEYYQSHPEVLALLARELSNASGVQTFTRREYNQWQREPIRLICEALVKEALVPDEQTGMMAAWAVSDLSRGVMERRLLNSITRPIDYDISVTTQLVLGGIRLLKRSRFL
jgi:AcrR family transcriptional regulator